MAHDERYFQLIMHPLRHLEVVKVTELTPMMRRITLGGPELEGFISLAPEDHIKVFFVALRKVLPDTGSGFAWLAGEASEVRAALDKLVKVHRFDKSRVYASGHWKRGVSNHDHHEEIGE